MASLLRRWEIVAGYVLGFGLLALVQSFIVASAGVYWLKLPMLGRFIDLLAVTVLLGLMALTTGLLVSEFANSELQVVQMLQAVVVPQIFLSGFFDLSTAPQWMQTVSALLPLTYAARALRGIMLRGQTLSEVGGDVLVLLGFWLALLAADVYTLRKYRAV
jgi:ABC-2 type transport system permease protein